MENSIHVIVFDSAKALFGILGVSIFSRRESIRLPHFTHGYYMLRSHIPIRTALELVGPRKKLVGGTRIVALELPFFFAFGV